MSTIQSNYSNEGKWREEIVVYEVSRWRISKYEATMRSVQMRTSRVDLTIVSR